MNSAERSDSHRPSGHNNQRPARLKLGQLLLERGWISGEQLLRAVQSQRAVGGRIGTCLLEMDAVSEDHLLDALAAQLGVPAIRIDHMRAISQEILSLVPPRLAARFRAVPFAADSSEVQVAALDVDDLARLDELAFCADKTVRAHIANEARLYEALERYYGVECPQRYGHLLDRLNRERYMWKGDGEVQSSVDRASPDWPTDPVSEFQFQRTDDVFGSLDLPIEAGPIETAVDRSLDAPDEAASEPVATAATPADSMTPLTQPRSLDEVAEELAGLSEVEAIAEVLLGFLGGPFVRCALLRGSRGHLEGWHGFGPGLDRAALDSVALSLEAWPALRGGPTEAPTVFHGRLEDSTGKAIAECWEDAPTEDWWQLEVRLKDRLVSVILGHRDARPISPRLVAQLGELAEKAAIALELCILRKKIRRRPRDRQLHLTPGVSDH